MKALEELTRYESAVVANSNVKNEPGLALLAIEDYYQNQKEIMEDPIAAKAIAREFEDAQVGLKKGIFSSAGLLLSMDTYTKKYDAKFNSTNISDLIEYLGKEHPIPAETLKHLTHYKNHTLEYLAKEHEKDGISKEYKEDLGKAITAITKLKERVLKIRTMDIYNAYTDKFLEGLYAPKKARRTRRG